MKYYRESRCLYLIFAIIMIFVGFFTLIFILYILTGGIFEGEQLQRLQDIENRLDGLEQREKEREVFGEVVDWSEIKIVASYIEPITKEYNCSDKKEGAR